MRLRIRLFIFAVLLLFLLPALSARAEFGGAIEAQLDGRPLYFPLLRTDIAAQVQGDVATVTVKQTFENPAPRPVHARYLFPLNHDAAVFAMTLEVGAERVRAKIQEIGEAERTFEQAKREGRAAALLREHRPNLFTQQIANLVPGVPIEVTLRYVQTVPKVDGQYELVLPLVVGPRFNPPVPVETAGEPELPRLLHVAHEMQAAPPQYPPVFGLDVPKSIESERVSLRIALDGGVTVQEAASPTHPLTFDIRSPREWDLALASERTLDNRDFVLRYRLSGAKTQAGLLAARDVRGAFFSLLLEPPAAPVAADVLPREMVFLLDCSGSMNGAPIEASKAFMRRALRALRPTDSFRIIRFSDAATEFSAQPLAATSDNILRGVAYVDGLDGEGGTMMSTGIRQALAVPVADGRVRIVTFLTDGYIGNEHEILGLIQETLGTARLYAFGVGSGVNRYLLDEIGRVGRGFTRYLEPGEDQDEVAAELAGRLQSPILTDIEIDWGALAPSEVYPAQLPDLFAGQSVRVQGRYAKAGEYTVTVRGQLNGQRAELPLTVRLPEHGQDGGALPLIWARAAVKEAMHLTSVPRRHGDGVPSFADLKKRVTQLGLDFALVTRWTAFVAVSEHVYNDRPDDATQRDVPLPMVKNVGPLAYSNPAPPAVVMAQESRGMPFAGASGPEPAAWMGLTLVALLFATGVALRSGDALNRIAGRATRPATDGRAGGWASRWGLAMDGSAHRARGDLA